MKAKSFILGVDTSHSRGQLCLWADQKRVENIFWEKKGSHSEKLSFYFQELLTKYRLQLSSFDKIYCTTGPGSFTGLRVGINFCKTLAYAHSIELVPLNSLHSLAYLCDKSNKKILSTIDAQKNAVFVSLFERQGKDYNALIENRIVEIKDLKDLLHESLYSCGSGLNQYKDFIDKDLVKQLTQEQEWEKPDITLIIEANENNEFLKKVTWQNLTPLYIRLSSAEEKLLQTRPKS